MVDEASCAGPVTTHAPASSPWALGVADEAGAADGAGPVMLKRRQPSDLPLPHGAHKQLPDEPPHRSTRRRQVRCPFEDLVRDAAATRCGRPDARDGPPATSFAV